MHILLSSRAVCMAGHLRSFSTFSSSLVLPMDQISLQDSKNMFDCLRWLYPESKSSPFSHSRYEISNLGKQYSPWLLTSNLTYVGCKPKCLRTISQFRNLLCHVSHIFISVSFYPHIPPHLPTHNSLRRLHFQIWQRCIHTDHRLRQYVNHENWEAQLETSATFLGQKRQRDTITKRGEF